MKGTEIFIDESGDFGQFDKNCPYYIVTLVRHYKSLPVYARLFQAADFACTIERINLRLSSGAGFARPEMIFFGKERRFYKDWLLPLRKKAWV